MKIPEELRDAAKEEVEIREFISSEDERHDPSNILKLNGKYYVWFTEHTNKIRGWYSNSCIKYATSIDGYDWKIQGVAISGGNKGEWDEKGTLSAYVVPLDDKYYMFYTGVGPEFEDRLKDKTGIGYVVADNLEGPWIKHNKPIL